MRRLPNVSFKLGTAECVDLDAKVVRTDAGDLGYDYLVLAAGVVNAYFGRSLAWLRPPLRHQRRHQVVDGDRGT